MGRIQENRRRTNTTSLRTSKFKTQQLLSLASCLPIPIRLLPDQNNRYKKKERPIATMTRLRNTLLASAVTLLLFVGSSHQQDFPESYNIGEDACILEDKQDFLMTWL